MRCVKDVKRAVWRVCGGSCESIRRSKGIERGSMGEDKNMSGWGGYVWYGGYGVRMLRVLRVVKGGR